MRAEVGAALANIGPAGRRQRRKLGLVVLGVTALLAAVMVLLVPSRAPRAFLLMPLWLAGIGLFQARAGT